MMKESAKESANDRRRDPLEQQAFPGEKELKGKADEKGNCRQPTSILPGGE